MYMIFIFIGILVIFCISNCIVQRLIIRRLREMNGGIEHPLCSKDGITINTRNAEYLDFLNDIEGEDDPELKKLKIYNKVFSRITIAAMIITFIMAAIVANANEVHP